MNSATLKGLVPGESGIDDGQRTAGGVRDPTAFLTGIVARNRTIRNVDAGTFVPHSCAVGGSVPRNHAAVLKCQRRTDLVRDAATQFGGTAGHGNRNQRHAARVEDTTAA